MMGYGYENAAGDRISALIDMINGGGPGRSGDTFEGGGILSLLANAVAKPYGSVRERPGHTPVGAAAAPMDVLRPEPVDAAGLSGFDTDAYVDTLRSRVEGAINRAEATSGRTFRKEDFAALGRVHPEVAKLFSGVQVGDPLSRQQAMFLNAARVGLDAPSAALAFPAPTDAPATANDGVLTITSEDDILTIRRAIETAMARNAPTRVVIGGKAFFALPEGRLTPAEEFRNPSFDLTAEEFTENLAPAPSPDVLGQETAGVTYPTSYGTIDSLDEVLASLRPAFEQALAAGPDPVYSTSGGDPYFVYSDGRVFDVLNARAGKDPFDVDPSVQDDLRARAGVTGTASR